MCVYDDDCAFSGKVIVKYIVQAICNPQYGLWFNTNILRETYFPETFLTVWLLNIYINLIILF